MYPPLPNTISIPALVAGNILQNDDTSVSLIDDGPTGAIVMKTNNVYGMVIDKDQNVSINTDLFNAQATINSKVASKPTLRLSYMESMFYDIMVSSNGGAIFAPKLVDPEASTSNLFTTIRENVNISNHDGVGKGLHLNGQPVTVSASELNYLDVAKGTAVADKAIVLNSSKNIIGLGRIGATELSGVLLTSSQPNINELQSVNIKTALSIQDITITASATKLNYTDILTPGVVQPGKCLVAGDSREIINLSLVSATTLTGMLSSGPQPNITSLSALQSLTNNGSTFLNGAVRIRTDQLNLSLLNAADNQVKLNVNAIGDLVITAANSNVIIDSDTSLNVEGHDGSTRGLKLNNQLVLATAAQLNYVSIPTTGTAFSNKALVLDSFKNISGINLLTCTQISGVIQTTTQPYINTVNTLNISSHNSSSMGLSLGGQLITASASQINYNTVTPGTATANKTVVLNSLKDINGIRKIVADSVEATVLTSSQPNINSVNTLNIVSHNASDLGLSLAGTLITVSASQINKLNTNEGIASPSRVMILNSARSISNVNSISAISLTGTLLTADQPNITSVNTLNITNHNGTQGLALNGTLITVTATQINKLSVSDGIATPAKVLIASSSNSISGLTSISSNAISGTLMTDYQPNVKTVDTLNIKLHDGSNRGLMLGDILVTANANQINYLNVLEGVAAGSKAVVLSSSGNITGINSLSASQINGTLITAYQPNVSRIKVLNIEDHNGTTQGLALAGTLVLATASHLNSLVVNAGNAAPNKVVLLDSSKNIVGLNLVSATTVTGTLTTELQPNIKTVSTLNISAHNGTIGLALNGTMITATADMINTLNTTYGVARANKALITNSSNQLTGLDTIGAASIVGLIQTASQPNISSVSSLNITSHNGASTGLSLGGTLVLATATQLNYNSVVPGIASGMKSMVTDAYNSITGVNSLSATVVKAQSLNVSGVISSFNTGALVAKSYSSTGFKGRIVDMQLVQNLSVLNFQPGGLTDSFSTEFIGYIASRYSETYTFYIQCASRVRLFVNNQLILHSWATVVGYRASVPIFMTADQFIPICIQLQCDPGAAAQIIVQWASSTTPRATIAGASLAWDTNEANHIDSYNIQNQITIYNSETTNANKTTMAVDTGGAFTIDASGNSVGLGSNDSLLIPAHNGIDSGLVLGGVLVTPTATEINYLKVNPGTAQASKAIILDASKAISGVSSLQSTSIACTSLSAANFTISNLTLNGALNNYNYGGLLIRQITGPDVSGRVVNVDTINTLSLTNYDPRGLNTYFSLDITGYIQPQFSDTYTFYAIADDRCRIFVNNKLVLNVWGEATGLEYTSLPITLTAGLWTPIYIQFQNLSSNSSLQVKWSSQNNLVKSFISASYMAWDNATPTVPKQAIYADSLTLYSSASGLLAPQFSSINVDNTGALSLSSNTGTVGVANGINFNVVGHNTVNTGLRLNGVLVTASANEINVLSSVIPGAAVPSRVMVLDAGKSITGLTTLGAATLTGTLSAGPQPNINAIGTITSTLNLSTDMIMNSGTRLRLITTSAGTNMQCGDSSTTGSTSDFFITNYNQSLTESTRRFVIKATSGFTGIQTSSPTRSLTINASGANFGLRLVRNTNDGTETQFVDMGADASGNLNVSPTGTSTTIQSNLTIGKTTATSFSVNANGGLTIASSNGSVQIGNTSNTLLPMELGSVSFNLGASSIGYLNASGSTGSRVDNTSNPCSLRTTGNVIVGGTVCVTSDRRAKDEIVSLKEDECYEFVNSIDPVQFSYKEHGKRTHYGFIAQEIHKTQYGSLVYPTPDTSMKEEVDDDEYVSPEAVRLNLSYTEMIPMLVATIQKLSKKTECLERELIELKSKNGLN